ncbi:RNA polymerase I-specific transcription initiation factor RRN7 [Acrasis kona]|uniref:RNA polymerase I-specific transcription initiation factor RRN7 n=1 Tax=Acrasis kona TaxID=1008807 RepID=A0AAW2YWU8_9EUKA
MPADHDLMEGRDMDILGNDDESTITVRCSYCQQVSRVDSDNASCNNCGEVLKTGNIYCEDDDNDGAIRMQYNKIKGGQSSLQSIEKPSYLNNNTLSFVEENETREGYINQLLDEKLKKLCHPVLCFLELYQRILMYQTDYLITNYKFPSKMREHISQTWLAYIQTLNIKKQISEKQKPKLVLPSVDLNEYFDGEQERDNDERSTMEFVEGSEEDKYVWSKMPQPWQTIIFIYLACIKLREPITLSQLKEMAENGQLPYRNVCYTLFSKDETFRLFSDHSVYFRMRLSTGLSMYYSRSYPIIFRDVEIPTCSIMWESALDLYRFFGLNTLTYPPINAYEVMQIICNKVFQLDHHSFKNVKKQLIDYACSAIQSVTRAETQLINTSIGVWFEENYTLKNSIEDMDNLRGFPPEIYAACYLIISIKMCMGLNDGVENSPNIWKSMVKRMIKVFNFQYQETVNSLDPSQDAPRDLRGLRVSEFLDNMRGTVNDEFLNPFSLDLKSKGTGYTDNVIKQMKNVLFGEQDPSISIPTKEFEDDAISDVFPPISENLVGQVSSEYIKYHNRRGVNAVNGMRLIGRVYDADPKEHVRFMYVLECVSAFFDISYRDLYKCMDRCENALL